MNKVTVKPASDSIDVINPQTRRAIPQNGQKVVLDKYFSRRIKDGDLVVVEDAKEQPARKKAHQPKSKIIELPKNEQADES